MKKFFLKVSMCVIALVSIMCITIFAGTADIQFGDPTTTRGKTFDLVVKVKSKDVKLAMADISIHYDPEKLEFVESPDCEGGSGMIRINGKGQGSKTTTLEYRLKFKALSAGKTQITLQTYEVTDVNDNPVNIEHKGSSTVNVKSATTTSKNANLRSLDVQPGELSAAFDQNVQEYTCEVNADVDSIGINAYPEDNDAKVEVKGNENLATGENKVEITVTAPNNSNKKTYVIRVNKLETGVTPGGQSVIDGQRITSEKYYVTYMDFPDDATPFDGYVEGTAHIDGNEFAVWEEKGNQTPPYFIFYGMDSQGDIGYYRYDQYKYTIQRNFQDAGSESLRLQAMNEEVAVNNYNKLVREQRIWIIACICLGAFSVLLIIIVIIMLAKKSVKSRSSYKKDEDFIDEESDDDDDDDDDDDFFMPKKETIKRTIPDRPIETNDNVVEEEPDNNSLDIEDLD